MSFPLAGRTAFISGASRGIGLAIALALAARGANIVVAAKSATPHPTLPGTIHSAAAEVEAVGRTTGSGARALPVLMDVRSEENVEQAVREAAQRFGGIDVLVNNASAISMKPSTSLSLKSFDLMSSINSRGTFLLSRAVLPHLLAAASAGRNPHILTLSPPLHTGLLSPSGGAFPAQFAETGAGYAVAKLGMSLATLGLAAETLGKVAVNALWPYTMIGTSAMRIVSRDAHNEEKRWRSPEIVAEAAARMIEQDARTYTAKFEIDEAYLRTAHGFTDAQIRAYSLGGAETPLAELKEDLYISDEMREEVMRSRK